MGWFSNVPPVQDDANAFSFKIWFQQIYRMLRGETRAITAITTATNAGEDYLYPVDCTAGAVTITLPLAANFQYKKYCVKKIDATANAVTIARSGSDTIDGATSVSLAHEWDTVIVASNGVATWYKINSTATGTTTTTIQSTEITNGGDNWNVPAGVGAVWLTAIGAGAGGEGNPGTGTYTSGKRGGGSGEFISNFLVPVTPGGTVAYSIGTGGAGGVGTYGSDGGPTTFGNYAALGGKAGGASTGSNGGGPGGGIVAGTGIGNIGVPESAHHFGGSAGGNGAASGTSPGSTGGPAGGYLLGAAGGTSISGEGGGGGGGTSVYGLGGAGGNHSTNGTSATSTHYGAGGGGAGGVPSPGGVTKNGGAGAGGYILITWVG